MNIAYIAQCIQCKNEGKRKVYIGDSARNLHVRSQEHHKDCGNDTKGKSWMKKRIEYEHQEDGKSCEFEWKVINQFRKPLRRQLCEAIHIGMTNKKELLNTKSEYFSNEIGRLELQKPKVTCNECGRKFKSSEELQEHFVTIHERFKCEKCPFISFGNKDLKLHVRDKHQQQINIIFEKELVKVL